MSGFTLTDQVFIQKITGIIHANMANDNFGVDELAHLSGCSRSVIHRRLQSITKKSTIQFIREVRLQRAMEMLQHESTTASEVGYKVGFSSPAYFNTCFHEYFGFPPGEVLRNEMREFLQDGGSQTTPPEIREPEIPEYEIQQNNPKQAGWIITGRHLIIYVFVGILIIIGLSILLDVTLFKNDPAAHSLLKDKDKSISVLPIKDLTLEAADQYLTEAMTKDILNKLVQIRELRVAASLPLKEYREDPLNIPLIARKLGVRFILFVNAQKQDNVLKVMVLLWDAKKNRYEWAKDYEKKYSDLFLIQSSIAKKVATELQAVIAPEDLTHIEKIPTTNMEAYSDYLRGLYYLNKGSWKEIDKSRECFSRAIEADSTFAEAFAGMADYLVNCYKRHWCPRDGALEKAKSFVTRALDLDDNLAVAHAILGEILCNEWKWKDAKDELERAIELNYNCANAHLYYAGLLRILRHNEESRTEINLAAQLNPTNPFIFLQSARLYWNEERSEDALNECMKVEELDSTIYSVYWTYFNIYMSLGQNQKAVESLQKALSILPEDQKYVSLVKELFDKEGLEGLSKAVIQINSEKHESGLIGSARYYNFLGEKDKALEYLEKAVELDIPGVPYINNDIDLGTLRNEPRFQILLAKMGLKAYQEIVPVNSSR